MHVTRPPLLVIASLFLCGMPRVWAQAPVPVDDTLKFNASYALQTDSNLFRLSDATLAQGGSSTGTEHIRVSTVGLKINKPYSLQRFELNLNLIDNQYQRFSYLNYLARNADAAWRWSVTPKLYGNLTSSRIETLNDFADYPTLTVRNQRTDTNTRFDALYELDSTWRALGGIASAKQDNVLPLAAEGNTSTTVGNVGLRYEWASHSSLSYVFKNTSGEYTNRALQPATLLDNRFNQHDNELRLHWLLSGKTTADLYAAYIDRTHPNYAQRNYSGYNAGANVFWAITGKTTLTASLARDLASYQTDATNFSRTDRLILSPVWAISPQTALRLRYEFARRNYLGSPGGTAASQRRDQIRNVSLSLDWQPFQHLTLTGTLQNIRRTSNQPNLDFASNMTTIAAKYSY